MVRFHPFPKHDGGPSAARGFTLLEMVVALGIFAFLVVITFGIALSLNQAQVRATKIQIVQGDLRFSLENMTKEMRTGRNFIPANPLGGGAYQEITFIRRDGKTIHYSLNSGAIQKVVSDASGTVTSGAVTGDDVVIDAFRVYATGTGAGDGQPRMTISLRAHSREPRFVSSLVLQTSVTPRGRDTQN